MSNMFNVFRYILVDKKQPVLDNFPSRSIPKGQMILGNFKKKKFAYKSLDAANLGIDVFNDEGLPVDRFYVGSFAKCKTAKAKDLEEFNLIPKLQENWEEIIVIIDIETQHLFVQKNSEFGDIGYTKGFLQSALGKGVLNLYGHSLFVEYKFDKQIFWNIVNESSSIYNLELKLLSPNIFDTDIDARHTMELMNEAFDLDELRVKLVNTRGQLKVSSSVARPKIEKYIDYISRGEGSYSIRTNKGKFKSDDKVDFVDLGDSNYQESDDPKAVKKGLLVRAYEYIKKLDKDK